MSPAVDLQAFSVVEFKKISNGFCSRRLKLEALNPLFRSFANGSSVIWFDVGPKFLRPDGTTDRAMFDFEYIHPSTEGYRVWREALEPVFAEILGK